ncbi:MAG: ABC transporter permease [Spirochaetaceae bacterium]|nr:ABC transporter permease [Spirochaetaceae bacterium]
MKNTFYLQLAWTGIGKNKKLYLPYLITCTGMVMMYYIVTSLSLSPVIRVLRGGDTIQMMLGLGSYVVAFFSVLFLFYSNSFLIRRRRKEFGLYNILGMGKANIGRILFGETVITVLISLVAGLLFGVLFSKLGELVLVNMLQGDVTYLFTLTMPAVKWTLIIFPVIFAVIFLWNIVSVHATNPIELLHSENSGEKPPRANWFLGIAGVAVLGVAYYIAVTIEQPIAALMWFFIAVILVIAATYLIFIAGSVLMCRILQKNKKYYYKTEHFISVSSMLYRMKRNGAGLASICILATMVLVMIASTACLFFGLDDNIKSLYPYDVNIKAYYGEPVDLSDAEVARFEDIVRSEFERKGAAPTAVSVYRSATTVASVKGGVIDTNVDTLDAMNQYAMDDVFCLSVMSYDDFARMRRSEDAAGTGTDTGAGLRDVADAGGTSGVAHSGRGEHVAGAGSQSSSGQAVASLLVAEGTDITGASLPVARPACNEILVLGATDKLKYTAFTVSDGAIYTLKPIDNLTLSTGGVTEILPTLYCVVDDAVAFLEHFDKEESDGTTTNPFLSSLFYGASFAGDDDFRVEVYKSVSEVLSAERPNFAFDYFVINSPIEERGGAYAMYGGLLFLGIMLSIVFLFATILIVYYKQISEGFEDQSRFEIMQKVGMTKKDIRKSINSQMLTVFFLPLAGAGLHLAFAFPMIQKLLMIFGLFNMPLLVGTSVASFLAFAVFYVIVYKITTNTYYGIAVSSRE